MYKRVLLIATVFIVSAASTYLFIKPNPKKQLTQALAHLKHNNYVAAEQALKPTLAQPESLYRGYLEQARGRFENSERYLVQALSEAKKKNDLVLLSEILMARATNAYFMKRPAEFISYLESTQSLTCQAPGMTFFEGLKHYMAQDYAEALRLWNAFSSDELNEWQTCLFDRLFSPAWRKLHIAHCLVEEGDIFAGREILEKESHHRGQQEIENLATLFLGLTYLKEASRMSIEQRDSYYKLACFYFEHAQTDHLSVEKERVIMHLANEAEALLLADLDFEKSKWGLAFIHTLHEWKAADATEQLATRLAEKMVKQHEETYVHLGNTIRNEFLGTPFHAQLTAKVLNSLSQALKVGETNDLFALWALVESLSSSPKMAAKDIASLTSEEIFETIKKDSLLLTRTRHFIAFWEKLGRNQHERELLARSLLFQAKLFWHNEKQEKKGQRLMEIALKLSEHSPYIEKEICSFLTQLYSQAENSNMIRRLTLIYEAMEHFDISRKELASKATVANHLADAEYLFESHNYSAAKTHACWVLKLDPANEGARRIVGLCCFNLGEYNKALCYLKDLNSVDEDARKALMLSQAFASQDRGKHLCQIDASDSFDENE